MLFITLLEVVADVYSPTKTFGRYGERLVNHKMIGKDRTAAEWASFLGLRMLSQRFANFLNKGFVSQTDRISAVEFYEQLSQLIGPDGNVNFYYDHF